MAKSMQPTGGSTPRMGADFDACKSSSSISTRVEHLVSSLSSGVSPVLTTWRCTWRGTSRMASDSRALWDDSNWLSWPVVGDQRGRRVLGALSRGAAVFQAVRGEEKKMKQQRRLLFAPYLVPLTPWLWTFLLKGVEQRRGRTTTWKKFPK